MDEDSYIVISQMWLFTINDNWISGSFVFFVIMCVIFLCILFLMRKMRPTQGKESPKVTQGVNDRARIGLQVLIQGTFNISIYSSNSEIHLGIGRTSGNSLKRTLLSLTKTNRIRVSKWWDSGICISSNILGRWLFGTVCEPAALETHGSLLQMQNLGISPELLNQNLPLHRTSRWFVCTLMFERHSPRWFWCTVWFGKHSAIF